jgi:hypothetical protein
MERRRDEKGRFSNDPEHVSETDDNDGYETTEETVDEELCSFSKLPKYFE